MNGTIPQLVIALQPDGRVTLQANVDNTIMLYGLLEMAKDAIRQKINDAANGPGIIAAPAGVLAGLNN